MARAAKAAGSGSFCSETRLSRWGKVAHPTLADAQDLYREVEADLDTWEPVWRQNGWSDADIANARQQVHLYNRETFQNLGIDYGSN